MSVYSILIVFGNDAIGYVHSRILAINTTRSRFTDNETIERYTGTAIVNINYTCTNIITGQIGGMDNEVAVNSIGFITGKTAIDRYTIR